MQWDAWDPIPQEKQAPLCRQRNRDASHATDLDFHSEARTENSAHLSDEPKLLLVLRAGSTVSFEILGTFEFAGSPPMLWNKKAHAKTQSRKVSVKLSSWHVL